MRHACTDLIELFNALFSNCEQTILVGGAAEPLYLPKSLNTTQHQIFFTRDYFASALHEVAHWCIAGATRRLVVDYAYWYAADGRSTAQQALFERVEIKPQALEWIFSACAGSRFQISADNITHGNAATLTFKKKVYQQVQAYLEHGLPSRAALFKQQLLQFYQRSHLFSSTLFDLHDL